ncbi:MAG: M48 family metallopeptidase [Candidatus Peribacteraceae bacterium]|nr:M48 family metallopeptidase [Candidatus Peribacteraceae bacterium]MDD5741796.1 M48 family metallopeptidase [Candidatus Peribacteraceae bacterium]
MDFPYRIERTRNRTSSALFEGDGVLIRLAGRLSAREEQRHIASLLKRMARRYADHRASQVIDPFRPLIRGNGIFPIALSDGTTQIFVIEDGKRTSAQKSEQGWSVRRGTKSTDTDFRKFLWRAMSVSVQPQMEEEVRRINALTFGARVTQVKLRHMLRRFGSCGPEGRITLNTALLFVPVELRTYVIIHELAHILHSDHSRAFWASVESVLPAYKEYRKTLQTYRLSD